MRGAFQQNSASGSVTDRRASLSGWCISCREIEGVRMGGWCVKVRCGEDGKEAYLNGTGVVGRDISGQVPSTVCSPLHLYRLPNSQYITYLHVPVALPLATSRLCSFHSTGRPLSLATALQVGMCASSLSSSLIHHQYQTANIKISDSEAFH